MRELVVEELYAINGGDTSDYDFGYRIGQAARAVYDFACDCIETVKSWF